MRTWLHIPSLPTGRRVVIRDLPYMRCDSWEVEELSYIFSTFFGGNHGKGAKCKGCGSSTPTVAGSSEVV